MSKAIFRLCIIGNMIGRTTGHVTTQGLILTDLFRKAGYEVQCASSKLNRIQRLAEVVSTIVRSRKTADVLILEVYSGLAFVLADIASLLCRLFAIPAIFVLHGGHLPSFTDRFPRWVGRTLKRADAIVAPSFFFADEMGRRGFKVDVIPNVIDLENYPLKVRRKIGPKMLWMRSFHPAYNPQLALEAFAEVRKEYPNATLVMGGPDKGLEREIRKSALSMGLGNSVRFPGFLDEASKLKEFSEADIYLNTNRVDNTPVSVIEACAMGLAVVATDVGGVSHLISDRENGLLVGDGNAAEMAGAIKTLLSDAELAERLSRNGRLLAEKSAWSNVRERWINLFVELHRSGRGSREPVEASGVLEDSLSR